MIIILKLQKRGRGGGKKMPGRGGRMCRVGDERHDGGFFLELFSQGIYQAL
jgi:hypothetical protein